MRLRLLPSALLMVLIALTQSREAGLNTSDGNASDEGEQVLHESQILLAMAESPTAPVPQVLPSNGSDGNITAQSLLDQRLNDTQNNSNGFLSFEEWRKAKGAELPAKEPLLQHRPKSQQHGTESFGEEMEIDIAQFFTTDTEEEEDDEPEGKTYTSRFNFASCDCAAAIMKTNSEAKGASNILVENKDSYLLNPCSAPNKFVVVELCQDILVDSVVLANYEFFSSTFKKVRLSASETFPVSSSGWNMLGEFSARDVRDVQVFNISNPMIWAKYFRIEILDHYGKEYYCPLSVVRVHGRTMMEEYKQEEAQLKLKKKQEQQTKEVITNRTQMVCDEKRQECNSTFVSMLPNLIHTNILNATGIDNCPITLPSIQFHDFFLQVNSSDSSLFCPTTAPSVPQSSTVQESIYKNIMKRLSQLESNATLSVLYIEEQSKLISGAFSSLESNHRSQVNSLMNSFNASIRAQAEAFTELYTELQQTTEELLRKQRQQFDTTLMETQSKMQVMETLGKFQNALNAFILVLLLCLFFYVVLTRDTMIETGFEDQDNDMNAKEVMDGIISPAPSRVVPDVLRQINGTVQDGTDAPLADSMSIKRPMTPQSDEED